MLFEVSETLITDIKIIIDLRLVVIYAEFDLYI